MKLKLMLRKTSNTKKMKIDLKGIINFLFKFNYRSSSSKVGIIGASLEGLALALGLAKRGVDVTIFEKKTDII